jgi:N-acetylglutamate synthase-like GNAT family acetyltransferase
VCSTPPPPTMQTAIRRATEADLPAVERLVNGAYVVEEFFLEGGRIDLDELVTTARSGGQFIVLEEPGTDEMIGCVCVTFGPRTGFISLLSVHPTRQGQGFPLQRGEPCSGSRCPNSHR